MSSFITRFRDIGTQERYSSHLNDRIRFTNLMMILGILFHVPFMIIFPFFGSWVLSVMTIPISVLYASIAYWQKKGCHRLASLQMTLTATLGTGIYYLWVGFDASLHYLLLPTAALSMLFYHPKDARWMVSATMVPLALFLVIMTAHPWIPTYSLLDTAHMSRLSNVMWGSFIILLFVILRVYLTMNTQRLMSQDHQIQSYQSELEDTLKSLEQIDRNATLDSHKESSNDLYIHATQQLAHEIKNPMAMLLSCAELIKDSGHDDAQVNHFMDVMVSTVKRLNTLSTALLSVGSAPTFAKSHFSMAQCAQELQSLAEMSCKKKKIKLDVKYPESGDFWGYKEFIYQAILNVIINAIQFTPPRGTICLTISAYGDDAKRGVQVQVTDSGIGMSDEQQKTMFERLSSSHQSQHNKGLGLSFVKQIMDDHDGRIEVISNIDQGTSFQLFFPEPVSSAVVA